MKNEDSFIEKMRTLFVTYDIFNLRVAPLERLGYGLVTMMVVAVAGALITFVIKK